MEIDKNIIEKILEDLESKSANKNSIKDLCEKFNITSKELTLLVFDRCIKGLQDIREKINNEENLENEDWLEVAIPFRSIVNVLMNGWYVDKNL